MSSSKASYTFVVDDVGRARFVDRQLQAGVEAIDRDDAIRAEQSGARDRELSDGTRAPHRDHLSRLDVAHLGTHVAGRKNVGEEEHLLIAQVRWYPDRTDIGERDAHVFGLSACKSAEQMRIAK